MAIYHLNYWYIGSKRSDGSNRSLVACLAYRLTQRLIETNIDPETNIKTIDIKDFTRKKGLYTSKIMAPSHAPSWCLEEQSLVDKIIQAEKRKDARYVRDLTIALHNELSMEDNISLLENFINQNFVNKHSLVANYAVHTDKKNNPHAHVVVTTRAIENNGFSAKKNRDIDKEDFLDKIRKDWAIFSNEYFVKRGLDIRITNKSYKDLGLDVQATIHEGYAARIKYQIDGFAERIEHNNDVRLQNALLVIENPIQLLKLVCHKYTNFTNKEILDQLYNICKPVYEKLNKDESFQEFLDLYMAELTGSDMLTAFKKGKNYQSKDLLEHLHNLEDVIKKKTDTEADNIELSEFKITENIHKISSSENEEASDNDSDESADFEVEKRINLAGKYFQEFCRKSKGFFTDYDLKKAIRIVANKADKSIKEEVLKFAKTNIFEITKDSKARHFVSRFTLKSMSTSQIEKVIQSKLNIKVNIDDLILKARESENVEFTIDKNIKKLANKIVKNLSEKLGVFTKNDLTRAINQNVTIKQADKKIDILLREYIIKEHLSLMPRQTLKGESIYSTWDYIKVEEDVLNLVNKLNQTKSDLYYSAEFERMLALTDLSIPQQGAVRHVIKSNNISIIQGVAGAGKTRLLLRFKELTNKTSKGTKMYGIALAGAAARNGYNETGIEFSTAEMFLRKYHKDLKKGDVLVIDESGMLDVRKIRDVLKIVERVGAKVVMVGDINQAQPIDAGQLFGYLGHKLGTYELTEVRRQRDEWQRRATVHMANDEFYEALSLYNNNSCFREYENLEQAKKMAAIDMVTDVLDGKSNFDDSIILTRNNKEVDELNQLVRNLYIKAGRLEDQHKIKVAKGNYLNFSVGDRIMFLQNEYKDYNIRNGMTGKVLEIKGNILSVDVVGEGIKKIDVRKYNHITHAYAATINKWQGGSVESVYALLTKNLDSNLSYPLLTRHKAKLRLYYDKKSFDIKPKDNVVLKLAAKLSRRAVKYNVISFKKSQRELDYEDSAFSRVKEYKEINDRIFELYRDYENIEERFQTLPILYNKRKELAESILKDYEKAKMYLQEAGYNKLKLIKDAKQFGTSDLLEKQKTIIKEFTQHINTPKGTLLADEIVRTCNINLCLEVLNDKEFDLLIENAQSIKNFKDNNHYQYIYDVYSDEQILFGLKNKKDSFIRDQVIEIFKNINQDKDNLAKLERDLEMYNVIINKEEYKIEELAKEIKILAKNQEFYSDEIKKKEVLLAQSKEYLNIKIKGKNYNTLLDIIQKTKEKLGRFIDDMQYQVLDNIIDRIYRLDSGLSTNVKGEILDIAQRNNFLKKAQDNSYVMLFRLKQYDTKLEEVEKVFELENEISQMKRDIYNAKEEIRITDIYIEDYKKDITYDFPEIAQKIIALLETQGVEESEIHLLFKNQYGGIVKRLFSKGKKYNERYKSFKEYTDKLRKALNKKEDTLIIIKKSEYRLDDLKKCIQEILREKTISECVSSIKQSLVNSKHISLEIKEEKLKKLDDIISRTSLSSSIQSNYSVKQTGFKI